MRLLLLEVVGRQIVSAERAPFRRQRLLFIPAQVVTQSQALIATRSVLHQQHISVQLDILYQGKLAHLQHKTDIA